MDRQHSPVVVTGSTGGVGGQVTAIAAGEVARVSDTVERLTGTPALTLAELLANGTRPP